MTKFDLAVKWVKVTLGSSFDQNMMSRSPRCFKPSFVEIGSPVPVKKIFEEFLPYFTIYAAKKSLFQLPKEVPHKIWFDRPSGFRDEDV